MGDLQPLKDSKHNETDYLVNQMTAFLKEGSYDNEQYANVTALMNDICQINANQTYAVSVSIDVEKYTNASGKPNRCKAIDMALDSMFYVFKRSAMNKSEPLDFSSIKFKADKGGSDSFYNLTDLINTSWIRSETVLEHVCNITDSIKEFVRNQSFNSTAQDRSQSSNSYLTSIVEYLNQLLDPIFGFQRRLYLEGTNRIQRIYYSVGNGVATISSGVRKGVREAGQRVYHTFVPSQANLTSTSNHTTNIVKTNLSHSNVAHTSATQTNLTQNK